MVAAAPCASWSSFRDSLKVLEANIQHANTLASECSRDYDRACLQMRMSYSPAVRICLFLMQWTNCSLAGTVGLLRILLFMWMAPPPCPPTKGRPASGSSTINALLHNREQQQMFSLRYSENTTWHMNSRLLFW